ncbi:hypothetical protein BY996DRAFT_6417185 [Phakopsora pachyrhizi]|nr:hypothetical protein BY996DRAFT_6417185 [Phakopsora pachyrhizi]
MIISSDTEEGAQSQIKQGLEKVMTSSSFITLSAEIGAEDFERRSRINDLSMNNSTKDSGLGIAGEKSTGEDRPVGATGHFHCLCHLCFLCVIGLGTFLDQMSFYFKGVVLYTFSAFELWALIVLNQVIAGYGSQPEYSQKQQWERGIWEKIKARCKPWVKLDKTTGERNIRFLGFETPIVYNVRAKPKNNCFADQNKSPIGWTGG